jgi:hypothetical protein
MAFSPATLADTTCVSKMLQSKLASACLPRVKSGWMTWEFVELNFKLALQPFSKLVNSAVHHLAYLWHKPSRSSNMPPIHIHVIRNAKRSPPDTAQEVMRSHFQAPPRDRYQIITQHDEGGLICEDTELANLPRSKQACNGPARQRQRDKAGHICGANETAWGEMWVR